MEMGVLCGIAWRLLDDRKYALRYLGKAETITQEDFDSALGEVVCGLVAVGQLTEAQSVWREALSRELPAVTTGAGQQ